MKLPDKCKYCNAPMREPCDADEAPFCGMNGGMGIWSMYKQQQQVLAEKQGVVPGHPMRRKEDQYLDGGLIAKEQRMTESKVTQITGAASGILGTLQQRGQRYGRFDAHAEITQLLKDVMRGHGANWNILKPDQREALEMIAHKIGRILNGDPNYADSWHDIAGYAQLVENRIQGVSI